MSNIVQKVKDAMSGDHHKETTAHTTHDSKYRETTGTGVGSSTTDTYDTGHRTGPHRSDAANKLDPRIDSDRDNSATLGTGGTANLGGYGTQHGSTNYGPHNSNVGNKLDPRVDSDQDGSYKAGGTGGYSGGGYHAGIVPTTGLATTHPGHTTGTKFGTEYGSNDVGHRANPTSTYGTTSTGPTNYGPHSTNTANKLDPRYDSDRDHRANPDSTFGTNTYGSGTATSTGSTNYGPHGSNIANKLDPHVDSDRDHRANPTSTTGTTTTGSTNYGPHGSNTANKLDPRFDSDRDHRAIPHSTLGSSNTGYTGGTHSASGPAPNTAGPHKSDLVNKLDPRVDSDLDGSRTYGGDKTHSTTGTGTTGTTDRYV